jgi:signal transduction histidine kinase
MKTQINNHFVLQLKFFSRILATLIFFIGFLAICGWQFNVEIFKKVTPNLPVIAPNTAFSFILVGLLIFFLGYARENRRFLRTFLEFFSLSITLLGTMTLLEYIFSVNFGIDGLLFSQKMGASVIRMSPQSAFNFLAVGLALFFYSRKGKRYVLWGQILIVAAGITALVSLFGFVYGAAGFYTIAPYKGMAAHTAVAFVMIFLGILASRPEAGLVRIFVGRGLSSLAARRLFLALAAILAIEFLAIAGGRMGLYNLAFESLFHLIVITGVFIFLIFYSFRSLDQLAEAEESLEHLKEIDRAKTEFVSMASHQLRTPLTSVSWYAEMLLSGEVGTANPKQKEYLAQIYANNQRMINLVDDLLNTSKIDMGMLSVEPRPMDPRFVIESVLMEIGPLAGEKNIEIKKNFSEESAEVGADPELMRVVFQNLISNALKYTPTNGKISIDVQPSNSHVDVKIADSGYGIPKVQQNKVFTKMFRADNIRDKVTDGTGLGLYIVKAIVKQSGGKISFESEEGKGTTFFVTLPIKRTR